MMNTQRISSSSGKPLEPNAPASVSAPARSGGRWGANVDAVLGVATVVLLLLLILEILVKFVGPGFQELDQHYSAMTLDERRLAREWNAKDFERTWRQMVETQAAQEKIQPTVKSEYIGQANFPYGDSIEITSVERSPDRMIVRGHYNLVSADRAQLALLITTTNTAIQPYEPMRRANIWKGSGDFTLMRLHEVPGLPHLNMYSTNADTPFAELYFGTKEQAAEESKLDLTHSQ
jgi:hypothetical protein